MAIKSVLLLGVIMAFVLLICQNVAYARVLTEANGFQEKNVEPTRGPGLEGEKWFLGIGGGIGGQPEIGVGYQPVYGGVDGRVGGYGGYGYVPVYGGVPGYVGGGVPGYAGGIPGVVPGYVGGGVRGYGGYGQVPRY
ncbi:hypothetical protein EJB05_45036 [Eragrostis curvula]|uniref:Glycine-rich protein n=1 Tax=Eragrostis curvula TaxID=38414 RepID=A0A5J9TJA3_9POAL|nr:hypothetical protein EJB05_45036 [Eragrostis curvula]